MAMMRIEIAAILRHIQVMSKTAKTSGGKTVRRTSRPSEFLGVTKDGIWIPRPSFKPVSFTERQLERAIRAVREREQARENEATAG
jgi:hypothetical protein